jgi:regulator of RNase E activity RraA
MGEDVGDRELLDELARLGTATISGQLIKKGLRKHWIAGARPLFQGRRIAGRAFTFRFIPGREDISTSDHLAKPGGLGDAVEAVPAGAVLVIESHGVMDSGLLGDILCERLKMKGVAGLVTDGGMRDMPGLRRVDWPIWCRALTPPPALEGLYFCGTGVPVGCGGIAVFPGDVIVADDDGAVLVPPALLPEIVAGAAEHELFERWVIEQVQAGRPVTGIYPPTAEGWGEYEQARQRRD